MWLCNPKQKILDKQNMKTAAFQDGEKITVTQNFSNPNIKVTYTPPQTHKKKEKDDEKDKAAEKVDDKEIRMERQNIIDAVIVRIMKARKTEKHIQLMEDCIKQVTIFMPQPAMIK
jgi:ssDNA-binding Zn-finger/Zn-ribbon topoisomerase 1